MAGIILVTAWPIRGNCVPQETGGKLTLTAPFSKKWTLGKNSNISGLIGSIFGCFLFDRGTQDFSLVNILLIDLSTFIDFIYRY